MLKRLLKKLENWKPIHLCWFFKKRGWKIPKYLIGEDWTKVYDGAAEPDSGNGYDWTKSESGETTHTSDGDIFTLDTTAGSSYYCFYSHSISFYSAWGYRIEARLKVHTDTPAGDIANGLAIFWKDDNKREALQFEKGKIKLRFDGGNYEMDTTDAYHVYRIEVSGTDIVVRVDGIVRITGTMTEATAGLDIVFGDTSGAENQNSESLWDYLQYYSGASSSSSSSSFSSSSSSSSFSSSSFSSSSSSFSSSSSSFSSSSSSSSSYSSSSSSYSSSSSSWSSGSPSSSSSSFSSSSSSFSSSSSSFSSSSSCSSSSSSSSFSSSSSSPSSFSSSSSSFSSSSSSFSSSSSSSSSFSSSSSSFSSSCSSSSSSSSLSSSSSESAIITERKVIIKLYDRDNVYVRNLKEAIYDFNIEKTLYSGSGPLALVLRTKVDDLASDITLNSKIRIYVRNTWSTSARLVYYGYIVSIDPIIRVGEQQTGITCLGSISKLQNDFLQHTAQLYEGQLAYLAFEVENKAVDVHINEILDNYRESINATYADYDPCMIDDVGNYWADSDFIDTSFSDKIRYRYFTSKHLEAIREISKFLSKNQAAGEFFYWYLDDGDNDNLRSRFHLQTLSTTADHKLQLNKHITRLEMRKNIEGMVNTVYFWNERGKAGEKILMTARDDSSPPSQEKYDVIADRITDSKVTTRTQGDLLAKARLKEAKDEKAEMTVVVSDVNYDILDFKLGDVINIRDTTKGTTLYPDDVMVVQKILLTPREVTLQLAKPRPDLSTQVESDREFIERQLIWFGDISTRIDATRLNPGSLHWVTEDISFAATDYRNINWLGGNTATVGTFKLPNGVNRVIAGGSTGNMSAATTYWLYVDEKNCWCGKDTGIGAKESGTKGAIKAGENSLVDTNKTWTKDQWKGYVLWVNPTGATAGEEKHIISSNYEHELVIEGDRPFRTDKTADCPYEVHPFVLRMTTTMSTSGTADSGSTTTLVDNALDQVADFWNGYELKITSGSNIGLSRIIDDFVATADRLVFDDLPYAIDNTTHYELYLNPESQIVIITGVANTDTNADAGIEAKTDAVSNPGSGATIDDITGAHRAFSALNTSNVLVTDLVNARMDTSSKKILYDFNFGTTNYAGAVKTGDIAWDASGTYTSGTGVAIYRKGIVGANGAQVTFSIDATTGNASFLGTITAGLGSSVDWSYIQNVAIVNADIVNLSADKINAGTLLVGYTEAKCTDPNADQTSANAQPSTWLSTAVEAAKLGTTVIVGGYIKTSLLTADNIQTGTLSACTIDADAITTGTITGRKFRTSSGDARAEMVVAGDYANQFVLYNGGTMIGRIKNYVSYFDIWAPAGAGYGIDLRIGDNSVINLSDTLPGAPIVKVNALLRPLTTSSKDLGSSSYRWDNLYINTVIAYTRILPDIDGGAYLGSSTKHWSDLYVSYLRFKSTAGIIYHGSVAVFNFYNINDWDKVVCKADLVPNADGSGQLGYNDQRWEKVHADNIYCTNQTADKHITGDLVFRYKKEIVFRIDENPDQLNFYNKKGLKIMTLDQEGNLWLKGKIGK